MKTLAMLPVIFASACWNGYVLSVLWAWFIIPVFHTPALRIPHAIGLSLVASMLTHQVRSEDDESSTIYYAVVAFLIPAMALLYGWVVTWWL